MITPIKTFAPAYNPASIDGCVLYLPFWKTGLQGGSFLSRDKYDHLCTATNVTWGSTGGTFNGSTSKITVPDTASLDITSAVTVLAWSYHNANANEAIAAKWTSDQAYGMLEGASPYNLVSFVTIGNVRKEALSTSGLPATTWTFCGLTYNGSAVQGYVNGVASGTPTAATGAIDITTDDFTIGWGISDTYGWAGKIGEAYIYSRALSVGEIASIFNQTRGRYL